MRPAKVRKTDFLYNRGMSGSPTPAPAVSTTIETSRKRCKNCPKFFTIGPKTPKTKEFCSNNCRLQFHNNGSSFGKVKQVMEKTIRTESRKIVNQEFDRYVHGREFKAAMAAAGFIHRSQIKSKPREYRPGAMVARIAKLEAALKASSAAQPPQSLSVTRTEPATTDTVRTVTREAQAARRVKGSRTRAIIARQNMPQERTGEAAQ